MVEAVIINEDKKNTELLESLLKDHCPTNSLLGCAKTKEEAVDLMNRVNPNLIFMDADLHGSHRGPDVLENINQSTTKVIYMASLKKDATKASDYNNAPYMVKPINKEDLLAAMDKVKQEIQSLTYTKINDKKKSDTPARLNPSKRIAIPTIKDIELVKTKDIIYLSSDNRYTIFYLKGEKQIVSSKNLGKYEKLIRKNFYRIHSKYYVNLRYLKKIHKSVGSPYCEMTTGDLLTISQRKYSDFMKFLQLK